MPEHTVPIRIRLPGHPPVEGEALFLERSAAERALRALILAIAWPWACLLAFLIPPHGEPLALAFFGGMYLIYRAWTRVYLVRHFSGACPRCGSTLELAPGAQLKRDLQLTCFTCHFEPYVEIPELPRVPLAAACGARTAA